MRPIKIGKTAVGVCLLVLLMVIAVCLNLVNRNEDVKVPFSSTQEAMRSGSNPTWEVTPINLEASVSNSIRESIKPVLPIDLDAVATSKDENHTNIQEDENATLVKESTSQSEIFAGGFVGLKPFEWVKEYSLPSNLVEDIKGHMRPAFFGKDAEPKIITQLSILPYVGRSLSMAFPPVKGVEIDGYFFLSGGTSSGPISDFSTGIAVDAKTGEIYLW